MQIWISYKKKHVDLLEGVQRRAARMIDKLRHLSYEERLQKTSLLSLFRINTGRTREHSLRLKKEYSRPDVRKYFFSQRIVNEWNALPPDVLNSESVNEFKNLSKPLFDSIQSHCISLRRLPAPLMTARDY